MSLPLLLLRSFANYYTSVADSSAVLQMGLLNDFNKTVDGVGEAPSKTVDKDLARLPKRSFCPPRRRRRPRESRRSPQLAATRVRRRSCSGTFEDHRQFQIAFPGILVQPQRVRGYGPPAPSYHGEDPPLSMSMSAGALSKDSALFRPSLKGALPSNGRGPDDPCAVVSGSASGSSSCRTSRLMAAPGSENG